MKGVDGAGREIPTQSSTAPSTQVILEPGGEAETTLSVPGSCPGAGSGGDPVYRKVTLTLSNGSVLTADDVYVDVACGPAVVDGWKGVTPDSPRPATPYDALQASLSSFPSTVVGGSTVDYRVTLTNTSAEAVSLTPCPSYQQTVNVAGGVSTTTDYLNCTAVPGRTIAAGAAVTFQMEMAVPVVATPASAKIGWQLGSGYGPFTGGILNVVA